MKIEIQNFTKVQSIKDAFNKAYPFLKIEFVSEKHAIGEPSMISEIIKGNLLLGEINSKLKKGSIDLSSEQTVALIEQTFQKKFGLPIQVFRKQNNAWIETSHTDHHSLAWQNEKGREASMPGITTAAGDRYLEDGQF
ncbi:hypothetical protein BH11BAC4_BH11BAC4_18450 [soil metagenome]